MTGIVCASAGKWEEAADNFKKAVESSKTVGDLKVSEESLLFLATVQFFQGDMEQSIQTVQLAIDSANQRGDSQLSILALNAQARNYYGLGDFASCISCLDEVKIAFESEAGSGDISSVNFFTFFE